jgi:hypothetical protein
MGGRSPEPLFTKQRHSKLQAQLALLCAEPTLEVLTTAVTVSFQRRQRLAHV